MEVILKQNFEGLGYKNDIVKVKPGYGRNYLIPQGFAIIANSRNKKVALENVRQAAHKVAKQKEAAEVLATQLDQLNIAITVKAGENGKIFGSITATQLVDALKSYQIVVDRKDISFSKPIKELGTHEATIVLHKDVVRTLAFSVKSA
ncbi:MAG: 50S ribosomal protein L9 [Bacteroidota bacterium]